MGQLAEQCGHQALLHTSFHKKADFKDPWERAGIDCTAFRFRFQGMRGYWCVNCTQMMAEISEATND